jgi:hypothetical protein
MLGPYFISFAHTTLVKLPRARRAHKRANVVNPGRARKASRPIPDTSAPVSRYQPIVQAQTGDVLEIGRVVGNQRQIVHERD